MPQQVTLLLNALVTNAPAIILAIATLLTAVSTLKQTRKNNAQTDVQSGKLEEIHQLANGALSAANARIAELERQMERLSGKKPGN